MNLTNSKSLTNRKNLTHYQNKNQSQSQSGVVLFIALVALVVMSLAAVALIRSVDTNSQIAGNLSYKQTASISSSYGIESMAQTVGQRTIASGYSNVNDAGNGYYATCTGFDQAGAGSCNGRNLTADASWVPGTSSSLATDAVANVVAGVDAYGNTIQYIVERMCSAVGAASSTTCLQAFNAGGCGGDTCTIIEQPLPPNTPPEPVFRVTVRIAGPKNTVSYIQTFLY